MSARSRTLKTLVVAWVVATPQLAFAWSATGHRIVGQVAEEHLSAEARQALAEITGSLSLPMLSTWADFIRAESAWDFAVPWHFVTVEDDQTLAEVLERSARTLEPDNLVEAIEYLVAILGGDQERRRNFEEILSSNGAAPYDGSLELTAVAFLTHFVGDLHQPLHVGRGGDQGGNRITVNWFGETRSLHSVWDRGLVEHTGLSFTELTDFLQRELAAEVEAGDGGPRDWARESFDYRRRLYEIWNRTSRDNHLPDLSWDYAHDHIGVVKRRLFLAGLRLAGLLDSIFD